MAKSSKTSSKTSEVKKDVTVEAVEEKMENTEKATSQEVDVATLMAEIQRLSQKVQELQSAKDLAPVATLSSTQDETRELLKHLANRRSDKEVVIVHNCELLGGLTTHLELSNLTIDFHSLGEQRILSWQQFEECVSKYPRFFERHYILLAPGQEDIGKRYNVPVANQGKDVLTHEALRKLPTMDATELENYYKQLDSYNQEFLITYWLGQCYNKVEGFYDRYKIERLNGLSSKHPFDNLLALMNGDFLDNNN